ncbi:MAG: hypothetical protein QOH88_1736 [Verrucomicrobiota bacterium]|jgi:hypothetical protein
MSTSREVEFDFLQHGTLSRTNSHGRGGRELPLTQEYFFNERRLEDGLGAALSDPLADWLEIANAIYVADRLVLRECSHSRNADAAWARKLRVKVGVRDVEFWRESGAALIRDVLHFLTDDVWELEFFERASDHAPERQQYLFHAVPPSAEVALLSGGLDSFAGAVVRRALAPQQHFVFVSGATNGLQQGRQSEQVRYLKTLGRGTATHIVVKHGLLNVERKQDCETTQRSRGFLHLTLGCVTALACGVRQLHIYENGIGAINLPLDGSQLGTQNSRPVNPVTLALMGRLASRVAKLPFKIINPSFYLTKGELCADRAVFKARDILHRTISCDHQTRQLKGRIQCGRCTSCLLRRMSLHSAGLSAFDPGECYNTDLSVPSMSNSCHSQMLEKMTWQASTIRRLLAEPNPWEALSIDYPMLARVASELSLSEAQPDVRVKLMRLYSKYAAEWDAFALEHEFGIELRAA